MLRDNLATMKHAWILLCAVGCGSSGGGGEPQLGNAMIVNGGKTIMLATGSAIQDSMDATKMAIQLGSDNVSCTSDIYNKFPGSGTYVYLAVDKTTPGSNPMQEVDVLTVSSNHIDIVGGSGTSTVTSIDTRVMGSVSYTFTDSMTNNTITVSGNFDVKKCF